MKVVVASHSISLAGALEALLKTIPQMEKVDIVSNMADALRRVEDIKPTMLLLDLALAGKQPEAVLVKGVSFSAVITILTNLLSKRS